MSVVSNLRDLSDIEDVWTSKYSFTVVTENGKTLLLDKTDSKKSGT